jgi:hypothetical protein
VCLWNVVLFCLLLVGNKIDHLFIKKNIYIYMGGIVEQRLNTISIVQKN